MCPLHPRSTPAHRPPPPPPLPTHPHTHRWIVKCFGLLQLGKELWKYAFFFILSMLSWNDLTRLVCWLNNLSPRSQAVGEKAYYSPYLTLHCRHRNDSCIKDSIGERHVNACLIMRDKLSHKTVPTDRNVRSERRAKAESNRGPSAYQTNGLYRWARPALRELLCRPSSLI